MTPALASLTLPLARRLEPERAHTLGLVALRLGLAGRDLSADDPVLCQTLLGRTLPNPIGLAAGFDKDATAIRALRRLGFGLVEVGTVTPLAQPGHDRPRVFRLADDQAVINRYGLNNAGIDAFVARLRRLNRGSGWVGANIGINKTGADPVRDYPALAEAVAPHVDYVVLNVSSPNTPGLRDLQGPAALGAILSAVRARVPGLPPLLVKIAPDLPPGGLRDIVETACDGGAAGLVVSNTTLARTGLRSAHAGEAGGLSGRPLFAPSTALLAEAFRLARGRLVLIGCGGVATGADALAKVEAGASAVQVYTAFTYAGPALVPRLKRELGAALRRAGYASITDAIGAAA